MSYARSEADTDTELQAGNAFASRPAPPGRRSDTVYAVVRDHITQGILEPGLVLTESAVSRAFKVSRSPAAAALARLAEERLISEFGGRGYLVGARTNVPVRRDLAEAGLNLTTAPLDDLQQRGWRDRLYPLVEREIAASMAFGPFRIVGTSLAEAFGVSRTVAHEILTRLERVGLVSQASNGHWYVPQLTVRDVEEHYEIRYLLEPPALVEGVKHLAPGQVSTRLQRARALLERGTVLSEAEISLLENDLHRDIVLACANTQLRRMIERSQLPLIATHLTFERYLNSEEILVAVEQHIRILEPLDAGDASAAVAAMQAHLKSAVAGTIACLKAGAAAPSARIPGYLTSV
ncbi:GntR family transcriptional regulator [Kaistia sp. 32K]|uniref:GntR family transcriptional regulator n=1 Tax=Kaistia sp. 32K TaxID=2795690 RepID=UPI0019163B2B|nr:GntR family transcriptional regulator [Kaistia sp. 32K]BCP56096.1 GntR family transcriptional regulator [Kaistia sp. 32K]